MAESNGHDSSRLDRIEGLIEVLVNEHIEFAREHRQLLTAQVVLTDRMDKLTDRLDRLAVQVSELSKVQKHGDERLNALIVTVDGMIRNRPSQTS